MNMYVLASMPTPFAWMIPALIWAVIMIVLGALVWGALFPHLLLPRFITRHWQYRLLATSTRLVLLVLMLGCLALFVERWSDEVTNGAHFGGVLTKSRMLKDVLDVDYWDLWYFYAVHIWVITLVSGVTFLGSLVWLRHSHDRWLTVCLSRPHPICPCCGYDRRGLLQGAVCPECCDGRRPERSAPAGRPPRPSAA